MINIPLVRDLSPYKKGRKTGVWVHEQTGISVGGPVDTIATSIIERLTRYSHIYDTVNRFARAYDAHYNKLCNVQAYTFHKLVIAYGRERDQQLIVSFRPRNASNDRFNLNFGQTLPISIYDSSEVNLQEATRWNAHCMMATILKEKFNAKSDLTELVHYLVTTSEPLQSLSFFSRIRFQSCKVLAQLFNNDIPYPLMLKFHLMPINEVTLRLTYGHIHLEFIMLSGDTVAVRDSSRNKPRCAGLHQFFHLLSNGTSKSCKESEPRFHHSNSPIQPASLPPNMVDASPAGLSLSASLSVPPNSDAAAVSPAMLGGSAELETSSAPVVIDHETLRRAFVYVKIPGTNLSRAPLDDYLSALCFIRKLTLAFEAHMRSQSVGRFPFSEMRCGLDFVRVSVPVVVPPQRNDASAPQTPQQIGGLVSYNFHLDPSTLTLKLNLEYSKNAPPPNDIATLERYFELIVCRLNNELAVFSFINLCRMVANGAVSGIAHVMNAQMDPSPSTYWNVSLQLICLARDQSTASARRYQFGTVFDANNVNALILICFRPSRTTSPRSNEKHLLRIIYNMQTLPKKLDGDRKISLVQFAHSTRMLFVKLLAVVKWVKSSKKFESCAAICYLLDQQSQYFVETADRLVTISREELVMARLPAFQVAAAVDVLTQGTYQHLPTIIKDRFVLKPKISPIDEANVLSRLNQVLQYRISKAASTLSPRIKGIVIKNGMLILTVPGEFEVNLTVLGEREQTPWTLLNIKMLVEDYEIGYGAQLVHPLQLHMLHNVLQSRMDVAKNPINEVYDFLHTFAQSLQLDVLFCQASQLAAGRLRNKIVIEKYDPKERILSIGYWVQRIAKKLIGNVR
nr:Mediator complex domain containing protein [Haemonchus contortus]